MKKKIILVSIDALLNKLLELGNAARENHVQSILKQVNRLMKEIFDTEFVFKKLVEDRAKNLVSDDMTKYFANKYEIELNEEQ